VNYHALKGYGFLFHRYVERSYGPAIGLRAGTCEAAEQDKYGETRQGTMGKKLTWNLWLAAACLLCGLIIAVALSLLVLGLKGTIPLPVSMSEADYFMLLMFLGMLGFGDLYMLYSALISFDKGRYDDL